MTSESESFTELKNYYQKRRIGEFFKIYIPRLTEPTFSGLSSKEIGQLDSIFVDVSSTQCSEIIQLILDHLDRLFESISEESAGRGISLILILRSIIFSSPFILQKRTTAEKLITDICDRLEKLKLGESIYFSIWGDILAGMVVKLYLALSTYETCDVDVKTIRKSLPKISIGVPWKFLLTADKPTVYSRKFRRLITKNIDSTTGHDCGVNRDDSDVPCLPGYCIVTEFWRNLLSNFALFRPYVDEEAMTALTEFLRQKAQSDGDDLFKRLIIDFLSVFDLNIDGSIFDTRMDYEPAISEAEKAEIEAMQILKLSVLDAIKNYASDDDGRLKSMFDIERTTNDGSKVIRQLQSAIFAFTNFETSKNLHDDVKLFFKDFSNRLYTAVPILITKFLRSDDESAAVQILIKSLDLFALMINEKALDLPKYPTVSVALSCASMIPWNGSIRKNRTDFSKLFETYLKFLRMGMKKSNNLLINLAPNWILILRRMQSILFDLADDRTVESDDLTSLFNRLGRFYSTLDRNKELEKISVFIIYDLVECLRNRKLTDIQTDALHSGIYRLIGISDSYSIAMITAQMDDTSKELFRLLHENYVKYYKYTGQV